MGKKFKGGYIGELDESQQQALAAMHERFAEWKPKVASWEGSVFQLDDRFLLKFLRARDFDVDKAADMLTKHLEFREKWKPHLLTVDDPIIKEGLSKGAWRLAGETKKGVPLQLIEASKFHPKDVQHPDDYTRNTLFHREMTLVKLKLDGWKAETSSVMFDLAGWSLFVQGTPLGMSYTRILIDIAQNHYPENLEQAIVFNAPFVFRTAWAIIRPWLDPATSSRVIFVTDPTKLHEIIDPSQLEERYGGTRKEEYPIICDFFPGSHS